MMMFTIVVVTTTTMFLSSWVLPVCLHIFRVSSVSWSEIQCPTHSAHARTELCFCLRKCIFAVSVTKSINVGWLSILASHSSLGFHFALKRFVKFVTEMQIFCGREGNLTYCVPSVDFLSYQISPRVDCSLGLRSVYHGFGSLPGGRLMIFLAHPGKWRVSISD
jgi:hypothetical protein